MGDTTPYECLSLSQGFNYHVYIQIFVLNQIYLIFIDQKVLQLNNSSIIGYDKINIL